MNAEKPCCRTRMAHFRRPSRPHSGAHVTAAYSPALGTLGRQAKSGGLTVIQQSTWGMSVGPWNPQRLCGVVTLRAIRTFSSRQTHEKSDFNACGDGCIEDRPCRARPVADELQRRQVGCFHPQHHGPMRRPAEADRIPIKAHER